MKRGQVAIFIIMGTLIVLAIVLFFVIRGNVGNSGMSVDASRVYNFVQGCANEVYLDAVYNIGTKGGYYEAPTESVSFGIPLYKIENSELLPGVPKIEEEIANGFDEALTECVGDFSEFKDLDVSAKSANSVAKLDDREIVLNVIYPMTVGREDSVDILRDFGEIRIPSEMGLMYKIAEDIVRNENASNICLTCLAKIADANDFKIDIVDYDVDTIFIIISYEELDGRFFEFSFAMKK